jgi:large subunit ribosomal protein L25
MEKVVVQATKRTVTGKKVRALRREGKLPGVLYGHNFESLPISMDLHETSKILHSVSRSAIITVNVDGNETATLIREKQRDFIRGTLKHVDFQVVSLTEKLRTKVTIEFVGLSPAVKDYNGIVVTNLNELEVESLPQDLPEKITVDLSKLAQIGDGIFVRDIDLGSKIEILTHAEELIVVVNLPKEEAEEVVVPSAEEPEVIERGKKPEEVEE